MVFSLLFGFLNIRNFYPILIFCFNVLYFFHTPLSPHDDSIFWNTSLFGKTSTLEVSSLENFYLSGIGGRRVYWDCIELKDDTRNAVNSAQQLLADFSLVNSCLNLIAVMSGLPSSQTCLGLWRETSSNPWEMCSPRWITATLTQYKGIVRRQAAMAEGDVKLWICAMKVIMKRSRGASIYLT